MSYFPFCQSCLPELAVPVFATVTKHLGLSLLHWDSGGTKVGKNNTRKRRLHPGLHIAHQVPENYALNTKKSIFQTVPPCRKRMGMTKKLFKFAVCCIANQFRL
ncbi:hypothetical protein TH25_02330 [Thalassospira profundimaris]|uniref:Uncharacterized protein n=1 Tax=Thalassospira profundimaris TaxID=502049 RepID=A0A367XL66_9PROT|nr:hypothetical protein TH25_02330 [Thalassospira profundimaris]